MMKAKDFRLKAIEECKPQTTILVLIELIIGLLVTLIGIVLGPFIILISGPFNFSYITINKKLKNKEEVKLDDSFDGFNRYRQALLADLLLFIFIFLWSLLLIVPGIIKSYSYALTRYLCYEDENKQANIAMKESAKLMYGHKARLFCLDISYIGWYLLSILTLGILLLWVVPKHRQARYNFYLDLIKDKKKEETK